MRAHTHIIHAAAQQRYHYIHFVNAHTLQVYCQPYHINTLLKCTIITIRQDELYSPTIMVFLFILGLLLFASFMFFRVTAIVAVFSLFAKIMSSPLIIWILPV